MKLTFVLCFFSLYQIPLFADPITINFNQQDYVIQSTPLTGGGITEQTVFIPIEICNSDDLILEIPGHVDSAKALLCNTDGSLGHLPHVDCWLLPFPDPSSPHPLQTYLNREPTFNLNDYENFVNRTIDDNGNEVTKLNLSLERLVYLFNIWASANNNVSHPGKGYHAIEFIINGHQYLFVLAFWPSITFDNTKLIEVLGHTNRFFQIKNPPYFELNYHMNLLKVPVNQDNFYGFILESVEDYENSNQMDFDIADEIAEEYSVAFEWKLVNLNETTPPFTKSFTTQEVELKTEPNIQSLKGLNELYVTAVPYISIGEVNPFCHYQSKHQFTLLDTNIYFPTAFSPNGDGINDTWGPFFSDISMVQSFELEIFDRWGNHIISSQDKFFRWQFKHWKNQLNPNLFVFRAKTTFINGMVKNDHGEINLIK